MPGCVIGAGSILTKDIPDGSVACGVPAKAIKTTLEYAEQSKKAMKPYDKEAYMNDKRNYLQKYL